jgi:site-specific DNA-methyltransferase (adenine-specific)
MKLFEGVIAMLNSIIHGDCLEVLMTLEDNSIDSIVTDPPYELGFMGKSWDSTGIAYNVELWKECLRVLKPGGHLLAFGGTRTYHRMTCAIEDAGFEIRDCIQWLYGSGFPKSHDISKAINKKLGTYPQAPEAQKWEGWGTALKPANEPIVLARKPLSEKTIAENVLKWGTGGINIDDCRIAYDMSDTNPATNPLYRKENGYKTNYGIDSNPSAYALKKEEGTMNINNQGRFPANVILDEEAGRMLDEQQEGASRFFYCAKASKKERNMGLEDVEPATVDDGRNKPIDNPFLRGKTPRQNTHPTVKPVKLMEYLITLITPPNGIVLDPFLGSGTTALAALNLGRFFIGIELNEEYVEMARRRVASHTAQQELKFA